jgi:hypothetical protein
VKDHTAQMDTQARTEANYAKSNPPRTTSSSAA